MWLFFISWNVVVKQGPWYHWYPGAARYTPNCRPHHLKPTPTCWPHLTITY